jgi:hypothetical protein
MTEPDPAGPSFQPGHCSDHPRLALATHREAGIRWYASTDPAVVCLHADHAADPYGADRCAWCGGRLIPVGTVRWLVSDRKAYCSALHRLHAFRARSRAAAAAEAKR